jgi:hypothetical protein
VDQIFSTTSYTVNQLIEKIEVNELGLPELQRPFVWKDRKVRDLFDSMMNGYPIGFLMIWSCPAYEKTKTIGSNNRDIDPKEVIIDGQQRLTSLFAVMKGVKVKDDKYNNREIIISYHPLENKFEVGYQATKNNKEWIYNISDLFLSSTWTFINKYFETLRVYWESKGKELNKEEEDTISNNITNLYNLLKYPIPVYTLKSDADEEAISDVFVRVNSSGVSLKQNDFILTLLSLYWEEGRGMVEVFSENSKKPATGVTSYNLITTVEPSDLIRTVMAYAFNRARLAYGYKLLRGADFDKKGVIDIEKRIERFEILKSKLPDVINKHYWHEFLKGIKNAGYLSGEIISSGTAIFYTYAFYLIAKDRFNISYNENMKLTSQWFFFAQLISLYTGSFESTMESHLSAIAELKTLDEYKNFINTKINERLTSDYFSITLLGSTGLAVSGKGNNAWNAYVASLNILKRKVLFSKSNLLVSDLFAPGTDGNRKSLEKHHLFPKKYLATKGYGQSQANQMANYAYIDWKDNMAILDEAPAIYYPQIIKEMSESEIIKMEADNALPRGWENMEYEEFLKARRVLMAQIIKQGFDELMK